jgi:glycosyltransferase involved in cell wall biosynthesis
VSVVIPAFNAERTLLDAIESALAQTHEHLEVIVVDDGSRDRTAAIASSAAARDARVRLVRQPNRGVAAARNAGLELARGDFVAPLDADDRWHPEKLALQLDGFESGGPRIGLVYCWSTIVADDGERIGSSPAFRIEGSVLPALVCSNLLGNASVPLIRRACLEAVGGFDVEFHRMAAQGCEDWDLAIRIAARYAFGVVPQPLVFYRRSAGTMSSDSSAMGRSYHLLLRKLRSHYPTLLVGHQVWQSEFYRYLMGNSRDADELVDTARWAARALVADPALLLSPRYLAEVVETAVRALVLAVGGGADSKLWRLARSVRTGLRSPLSPGRFPDPQLWLRSRRWRRIVDRCNGFPIDAAPESSSPDGVTRADPAPDVAPAAPRTQAPPASISRGTLLAPPTHGSR